VATKTMFNTDLTERVQARELKRDSAPFLADLKNALGRMTASELQETVASLSDHSGPR
jgi:hypothetical protein